MSRTRLVVAGLVWALLVATTTAFVATEALKLERPAAGEMKGPRAFSPECECPKRVARLSFRLREPETISVWIVDSEGQVVRELASREERRKGRARFRWNGKTDEGGIAESGAYRLRVRLEDDDRTVTFARRVHLDLRAPTIDLRSVDPSQLQPAESVEVRFDLSERARVRLRVDGRRASTLGVFERGGRTAVWGGRVRGEPIAPGPHQVVLVAQDPAGNKSERSSPVTILVGGPG